MADALQGQLFRGYPFTLSSSNPTFTNFTLNGSTDALEVIFQAKEAATISRLGTRLGTITGTTPTYRISLQGVTSAGIPDGTIKGGTNNALATFSPSGLGWAAGSWNWLNLSETYDVSRGEWLAWVIDYSSGTIDGSNNASFTRSVTSTYTNARLYPIENDAGVRSRTGGVIPLFGYGSTTKAFGFPGSATNLQAISSSSNPREVGFRFTTDASWGSTFKVLGVRYYANMRLDTSEIIMRLYQGGEAADTGTVLQSITAYNDISQATIQDRRSLELYFDEATLENLNFGSAYRISFESTHASSSNFHYQEVAAAEDWDAYPGGQLMYWTQRASGGNWADTTTRKPYDVQLIIDDITEPQGGAFSIAARRRKNKTIYRM